MISILGVTTRLVHLRLLFPNGPRKPRPTSRVPSTPGTIRLEHLQILHLRVEGPNIPDELVHLASFLYTPTLTSLNLIDLGDQDLPAHIPFPSLMMFLTLYAFPPLLQTLYVEHRWQSDGMVPLLRPLIHLKQVVFKKHEAPDRVFALNPRRRKRGVRY
jgi:hypothetical protein